VVKAFVESGVRGRHLEALRRNGLPQQVLFRLSRQVDAFEIIASEGSRASHVVSFKEVASVCTGDDGCIQKDLAACLPGLDGSCAVVDLRDGRCLTLRFPRGGESEATDFVQCARLFASEVQREACTSPPAL